MTKHDTDLNYVTGLNVDHSTTYSGSGSNRVGTTTVTLTFTLLGGDTVTKAETFSNIKVTTSEDFTYTIGNYDVTVNVTITVEGTNNNMNITDVAAEITSKVANQ